MASRIGKVTVFSIVVMFMLFSSRFAPAADRQQANFGDPLPGLTASELARFEAGLAEFQSVEAVTDGLGPVFNDVSCNNCHHVPASGGGSTTLETRFGRITDGAFDPMTEFGGSLIQSQGIGPAGSCDYAGETVPAEATIVAHRRATPLFGLGLVDAVPDATYEFIAAIEAALTPDTAGTPSMVMNLAAGHVAVGKFGWKGQNPTLFQFSGDAYLNEMGITNPEFPDENCPGGDCSSLSCNPEPALNDDGGDVSEFTDFMTFLAPPPRGNITNRVRAGALIFDAIGCANCHLSTLETGPNSSAALNHVTFHPYSDFLLHDMGSLGDGITQGQTTGTQMRTAPLWGVRALTTFLHDGRASTLQDAILAHDGQGAAARNRFAALNSTLKGYVMAFLNSL